MAKHDDTGWWDSSVLTLAEAAKEVRLSEKTLYRKAQNDEGPFFKVVGRWRCYRSELHAWMRSYTPTSRRRDAMDFHTTPSPRKRQRSVLEEVEEFEKRKGDLRPGRSRVFHGEGKAKKRKGVLERVEDLQNERKP